MLSQDAASDAKSVDQSIIHLHLSFQMQWNLFISKNKQYLTFCQYFI